MLYFLQTAAAAAGRGRTPDDMFGNWAIARSTGRLICHFTLENTAADTESFAITVKPGCDSFVTGFAPRAWRMDRGQFVLLSSKNEPWRFEESDVATTWKRIPEGRNPVMMMRQ
jgi:Protease inhibitor Inh